MEGESLSEEVQVWCLRVFAALHRLEGIVVGAQVEVVTAVAAAGAAAGAAVVVVVRQPYRMEQGHCVGEGSLEGRMAVGGIVVLFHN